MFRCQHDELTRERTASALLHIDYHVGRLLWVEPHSAVSIDRNIKLAGLKLRLGGVRGDMCSAREVDET